jgi:hypothetical protein
MRPNWKKLIAACLFALVITPAYAGTGGGRIRIQGAIVTPTCSVPTTWNTTTQGRHTALQHECANATKAGLQTPAVEVHARHLDKQQTAKLLRTFTVNALATNDDQVHTVLVQYRYR